jgi:general secretion pathway protein G
MQRNNNKGFTLVEILIVVIILGILAAIVIPQFSNASTDAKKNSLTSQLQTMRSQMELYKLQHNDQLPSKLKPANLHGTDPADWDQLTGQTDVSGTTAAATALQKFGPYLQQIPANPLNGSTAIACGTGTPYDFPVLTGGKTAPAAAGFVMNRSTGKIWATAVLNTRMFNESEPSDPLNDKPD